MTRHHAGRPRAMAVNVSVREGELARVWNGRKWCDGRIRRVAYSYPETAGPAALVVEIRYKECGCGTSVKAGQCRHVFSALDCGRVWVRDCPVQRKHRRATAELDRSTNSSSTLPKPMPKPRELESPSWPTAKFHRQLPVHGHKKRKKEAEGHAPQADAQPRWSDSDGAIAAKKWKAVGRRMPSWRWPSYVEGTGPHRHDGDDDGDECTTGRTEADVESTETARRAAEERRRWRLEREQDWKRWQSSQKTTVAPSAHVSEVEGAGQTMRPHRFDGEELSGMFCGEEGTRVTKKSKKKDNKEPEKTKKSKKARRSSATSATVAIPDARPAEGERTPELAAGATTQAENGARELVLAYGEWVRLQSAGGVVWVEEGPRAIVLQPGDNVVSGPQRRLDLPDTCHFSNSFCFTASEAVVR